MYICNVYSFATMSNLHVHECQACLVCLIKCKVSLKACRYEIEMKGKKIYTGPLHHIKTHKKSKAENMKSIFYFDRCNYINFTHFLLKLNL